MRAVWRLPKVPLFDRQPLHFEIHQVRSSSEYVDFDLKHRLGFVRNEKRFNVAVTRAKVRSWARCTGD
jgi:hypothetical protein